MEHVFFWGDMIEDTLVHMDRIFSKVQYPKTGLRGVFVKKTNIPCVVNSVFRLHKYCYVNFFHYEYSNIS